jgi:CRP/FNR family transcriptional regulator, anaerobic regulatory protein
LIEIKVRADSEAIFVRRIKGVAMATASSGRKSSALRSSAPWFVAPPMWAGDENAREPLTNEERSSLALNATIVRLRKGESIYEEGDPAAAIFCIISGVVKLTRGLPGGKEHIARFMFANDLIGLAEYGRYVNSAQSITATALNKIPTRALETRLRQNPGLEFHIINKLCHDLRRTQDHARLMAKHRATAKIGLFLQMLEADQQPAGAMNAEMYLPRPAPISGHMSVSHPRR